MPGVSLAYVALRESPHKKKSGTCQISSDDKTSDFRRFLAANRLNKCDSEDLVRSLNECIGCVGLRRLPKIAVILKIELEFVHSIFGIFE